ncbi:transposase [Granulosicoccus antarcticus]|uniref:Transposase n=1 Tax=Granulosicoccus antarcticus IMCC3135 TaxID=1192854 RepID=A0A2Z2NXN2_9GAMM|nr:transposase [Granulosicoccus antarcticus]ASJ76202.1 hypothetical protein IMCC3135_30765 [Granulosicoccus antarcticus IMCC3135]
MGRPKIYSDKLKATAVKLSQLKGVAVMDVAESLVIHPIMLSRWRKEVREGLIDTEGIEVNREEMAELKELRRVKRQYERLKIEHRLLKKAVAFTSTRRETSSPSSSTNKAPGKGQSR